jgi:hypothetical protein
VGCSRIDAQNLEAILGSFVGVEETLASVDKEVY